MITTSLVFIQKNCALQHNTQNIYFLAHCKSFFLPSVQSLNSVVSRSMDLASLKDLLDSVIQPPSRSKEGNSQTWEPAIVLQHDPGNYDVQSSLLLLWSRASCLDVIWASVPVASTYWSLLASYTIKSSQSRAGESSGYI